MIIDEPQRMIRNAVERIKKIITNTQRVAETGNERRLLEVVGEHVDEELAVLDQVATSLDVNVGS
jgi:hypothetical protein